MFLEKKNIVVLYNRWFRFYFCSRFCFCNSCSLDNNILSWCFSTVIVDIWSQMIRVLLGWVSERLKQSTLLSKVLAAATASLLTLRLQETVEVCYWFAILALVI